MTRDELFEQALDCAQAARTAARYEGGTRAEAYARAGELFLKLAEHQFDMDQLQPRPVPDTPPDSRF